MELPVLVFGLLLIVNLIVSDAQTTAESELLVPNYDNVDHKLKAFKIRRPLVLHCHITEDGVYELSWEKDGLEVDKVEELKDRYTIIEPEHKFIIPETTEFDAGHYACRLGETKKEFHAMAEVVVRTSDNVGASESEDLVIECAVMGTAPRIHWEIGNQTIHNSTDRYKLSENKKGVKNAILKVENLIPEDRGSYTCVATNMLTELGISYNATDTTYVRVKDRMALVWPSLGILAEVLILGVITIFARRADAKLNYE